MKKERLQLAKFNQLKYIICSSDNLVNKIIDYWWTVEGPREDRYNSVTGVGGFMQSEYLWLKIL